ncbi:hypothetical protein ANRL1_01330 [Anaerolineae bacterium]|nr:hypothetical protein ANRL1_01330 [Anaerolineae bacterium]
MTKQATVQPFYVPYRKPGARIQLRGVWVADLFKPGTRLHVTIRRSWSGNAVLTLRRAKSRSQLRTCVLKEKR